MKLHFAIGTTRASKAAYREENSRAAGGPVCAGCGHSVSDHAIRGRFGPDECEGDNAECPCRLYREV